MFGTNPERVRGMKKKENSVQLRTHVSKVGQGALVVGLCENVDRRM